jgi:hypothetical protein
MNVLIENQPMKSVLEENGDDSALYDLSAALTASRLTGAPNSTFR